MPASVLGDMQRRLRQRMLKQGGAPEDAKPVDMRYQQWLALQTHTRKLTKEDFLTLVDEKRKAISCALTAIRATQPQSVEELAALIAPLDGAEHWYPGGFKELKTAHAEWQLVEKKMDSLLECLHVTRDMQIALAEPLARFAEFDVDVKKLCDTFRLHARMWGGVLSTQAATWRNLGLPVDDTCLRAASSRLEEIAVRLVERVVEDTESMARTGFRLRRSRELRRVLLDSVRMLSECGDYGIGPGGAQPLRDAAALAAEKMLVLSNLEFEHSVGSQARAAVTAHYDDILRPLGELKTIAKKLSGLHAFGAACNILDGVDAELQTSLRAAIYQSCKLLMEHIVEVSQPQLSKIAGQEASASSKEIVLWLMFGCKFTNKVLELFGEHLAADGKMQELLGCLQTLEVALPTEH